MCPSNCNDFNTEDGLRKGNLLTFPENTLRFHRLMSDMSHLQEKHPPSSTLDGRSKIETLLSTTGRDIPSFERTALDQPQWPLRAWIPEKAFWYTMQL